MAGTGPVLLHKQQRPHSKDYPEGVTLYLNDSEWLAWAKLAQEHHTPLYFMNNGRHRAPSHSQKSNRAEAGYA